jgi:DNA-binding transcriptional ArsR family regulator
MSDARIDELERRIAHLESRIGGEPAPVKATRTGNPLMAVLHAWRREDGPGTVGYAGHVADREALGARQMPLAELLAADWTPAAGILESLGSQPRLALLGALLRDGRRTNGELQEALGDTTTGQLYHHLRALQGAGLIVQRRRGEYDLAPQAVIPVLAILAAAMNLATDPAVPVPG